MRTRLLVLSLAGLLAWSADAVAQPDEGGSCRVMQVHMVPTGELQIAVWLEDARGNFVDTAYVTRLTGTYGLGNRPGIQEFNSSWRWPYGRRQNVLPVWAHRRGVTYPRIVFQDGDELDLSHPISDSAPESFYCRPLDPDDDKDKRMIDTTTCATAAYVDRGKFHPTETSLYPPRNDLAGITKVKDPAAPGNCLDGGATSCTDHPDVLEYSKLNDLDAVSRATPAGGSDFTTLFPLPADLPAGDYVVWVEASKQFDFNDTYNPQVFPSPSVAWGQYGKPYRGQPSVVWQVPIRIEAGTESRRFTVTDYAGYSDPSGLSGELNAPDATISVGDEGSGANRLLVMSERGDEFRVAVDLSVDDDPVGPGAPGSARVTGVGSSGATVTFTAPADDGHEAASGPATGYEVRYLVGETITKENFYERGMAVETKGPSAPGSVETVTLDDLLPQTMYSVGILAEDDCLNESALTVVSFQTGRVRAGKVAFCAVAAGGRGDAAVLLLGLFGVALVARRRSV